MQPLYTARVTTTGGRDGRSTSADGSFDLPQAMPKALGGSGAGVNPELLFAAGYSACFLSALKLVASQRRLPTTDASVEAAVTINESEKSFVLSVELAVSLPGIEAADADELIRSAHQVCPYSKAIRGNVDVAFTRA